MVQECRVVSLSLYLTCICLCCEQKMPELQSPFGMRHSKLNTFKAIISSKRRCIEQSQGRTRRVRHRNTHTKGCCCCCRHRRTYRTNELAYELVPLERLPSCAEKCSMLTSFIGWLSASIGWANIEHGAMSNLINYY